MRERLVRRTVALCAALMLVLLGEILLANAMLKPVARDEHMYCTAAVLLGQGQQVYRDFSYPSQLPYHALLLAAIYSAFDTTRYLLAARVLSSLCDILVVLSIVGIYRHVFGRHRLEGLLFGLAAAVLYVFNAQVDYAAGYAWNHDVVILCVILAFWLFATVDFQSKSYGWRIAGIGALLTFATCTRVTTAVVEVLFLAAILAAGGGPVRSRLRSALPFSLAGLAVAAWPIWVCAQAPQAVWLNLVRIPALYGRWLHEAGMAHGKITMTMFCLTSPGYLLLLAVSGYLLWTTLRRWSQIDTVTRRNLTVALSLPLAFGVIAFVPPTMWEQYWAAPVPFLAVALAYPLVQLCRLAEREKADRTIRTATWAMFIGATMTAVLNPAPLSRLRDATAPQRWTPVVFHRISTDLVAKAPEPKRILTLGPLYALEGGGAIYRELSSGAIVYRIGDSLNDSEQAMTHTVGSTALTSLVKQRPPAAVLVGVEPRQFSDLEGPLRLAAGPDWHTEAYEGGLDAYFRP